MLCRRRAGIVIGWISFLWLLGVVGADDYNTMLHIGTPFISLAIKFMIGAIGLTIAAKLYNYGGDQDENSL